MTTLLVTKKKQITGLKEGRADPCLEKGGEGNGKMGDEGRGKGGERTGRKEVGRGKGEEGGKGKWTVGEEERGGEVV